jgi:hypothetical protein
VEEADSNAWSPFEKALPFMIQEIGFAPDSPLEEGVWSEPVSETGFPAPAR